MSDITIAVQCHNFQRRFGWMLSSIAQQTARDRVVVRVDYVPDNGDPTTDATLNAAPLVRSERGAWRFGIEFQKRGLVRNRQLAECSTKWIVFADCDMVYSPEYFERLLELLEGEHASANYCLSSGRTSCSVAEGDQLVASVARYPAEIPGAWPRAETCAPIRRRNVGAGFCQIARVAAVPDRLYVNPRRCKDWTWDRGFGWNTLSDMAFRKRMNPGGPRVALPEWFTRNARHINHVRDPDAGRHVDIQR